MIAIIDYGIGNLGSVVKAFRYLKIPAILTADKSTIEKADGIVLPGVGAFGEGMKNLQADNLDQLVKELILEGRPFLGICLGLQLLFTSSEENPGINGLNIISGQVKKFSREKVTKIPHMGWNQVELQREDPLFTELEPPLNFYFVHSYFVQPESNETILAKTTYGQQEFVSVINKDNLWGIQCHPEKSSQVGLKFLENFGKVVTLWK